MGNGGRRGVTAEAQRARRLKQAGSWPVDCGARDCGNGQRKAAEHETRRPADQSLPSQRLQARDQGEMGVPGRQRQVVLPSQRRNPDVVVRNGPARLCKFRLHSAIVLRRCPGREAGARRCGETRQSTPVVAAAAAPAARRSEARPEQPRAHTKQRPRRGAWSDPDRFGSAR